MSDGHHDNLNPPPCKVPLPPGVVGCVPSMVCLFCQVMFVRLAESAKGLPRGHSGDAKISSFVMKVFPIWRC